MIRIEIKCEEEGYGEEGTGKEASGLDDSFGAFRLLSLTVHGLRKPFARSVPFTRGLKPSTTDAGVIAGDT